MSNPQGKNQYTSSGRVAKVKAPKTAAQLKKMSDRITRADANFRKNGGINTPRQFEGRFSTGGGFFAGGGR